MEEGWLEGGTGRVGDQKQCEQKHRDLTVHGNPRKGKHQKWLHVGIFVQDASENPWSPK